MEEIFGIKIVRSSKGHDRGRHPRHGEYRYAIRHADFNSRMATIEKQVVVNFHKYIFTREPIQWIEEDPKYHYIQIHLDKSYTKEEDEKRREN